MRGFQIERTLEEVSCSMETLPEKILKIPGIALVAAGTPACLLTLYDSAKRINALERLFLCEISPAEYSLGKQGKKILQAAEHAGNSGGTRGVIIYASCMEVLTMWDFQREKKKLRCQVPVEILYRGPLVKRRIAPREELKRILDGWNIDIDESSEKSLGSLKTQRSQKSVGGQQNTGNVHDSEITNVYDSPDTKKPTEPYFIQKIRKLAAKDKECDILLFTPGGCASSLKCLPADILKNVWNTRFTDYVLSQGNTTRIAQEIKQKFPQERPLYLLESAVPKFTGISLEKIAGDLRKSGKEVYYILETEYR